MSGIASYLGNSIDSALAAFVNSESAAVSVAIAPMVLSAYALWVILHGLAIVRGDTQHSATVFAWRAARAAIILGVALSAGAYQEWVITGATGLTNGLCALAAPSSLDVYGALDDLESQGTTIALAHLATAVDSLPSGGYLDFIAAFGCGLAVGTIVLVLAGYVLLAKIVLALCLAVGPLFVGCLAFRSTATFFAGWLQKVLNAVFMMMLMTTLLGFIVRIYGQYLTAMAGSAADISVMVDLIDLAVITGAILLVIMHVPGIASGLAGGSRLFGYEGGVVVTALARPHPHSNGKSSARAEGHS